MKNPVGTGDVTILSRVKVTVTVVWPGYHSFSILVYRESDCTVGRAVRRRVSPRACQCQCQHRQMPVSGTTGNTTPAQPGSLTQ
eukprot:3665841-Rhodomonas_salina.1